MNFCVIHKSQILILVGQTNAFNFVYTFEKPKKSDIFLDYIVSMTYFWTCIIVPDAICLFIQVRNFISFPKTPYMSLKAKKHQSYG